MGIKLAPSMMCSDFVDLRPELDLFAERDIEFLHMDIMDGHYVPNFTLGPDFCKRLGEYSPIPLDIHLMIEHVDSYVESFAFSKGTYLSFHPEANYHPLRTIDLIKSLGAVPGIAVDPSTTLDTLRHLLPAVEFVCLMTVNPGYAGQKIVPGMIEKISELREICLRESIELEIEVDGNVSWENIPKMVAAGATTLVLGSSSLYDGGEMKENIDRLREFTGE